MLVIGMSFSASYAFGSIFFVCELCQQVCDGFEGMNETMDQFCWPLYPIKIRRLLPIVIIFTQQPIEFRVFGSIACCRDSFKEVSSINQIYIEDVAFLIIWIYS